MQAYKNQESELDKLREKCEEQEQLIQSQQDEVKNLKEELQTLKTESTKQVCVNLTKNLF